MCRRFHHVIHRAARGLQDALDILQRHLDLLLDGLADNLLGEWINRSLPRNKNHIAADNAGAVGAFGRIDIRNDDWVFSWHSGKFVNRWPNFKASSPRTSFHWTIVGTSMRP